MISVMEAEQLISSYLSPLESLLLPIAKLDGHILRKPAHADRPYPPFHRVAMDGIAVRYDTARTTWHIQDLQKAGDKPKTLSHDQNCIEIMTGAVLPQGCDTIIRYEDLTIRDGIAHLREGVHLNVGMHIHRLGADCTQDALLIESGRVLNGPLTGILAAIGQSTVNVTRIPRVAIVNTGDELVPVHETPSPFQIRASNGSALSSALRSLGIQESMVCAVPDDVETMRETFARLLANNDLLLLTGGVSAGKFDYVPEILRSLGVRQIFHKVRQKPGKPLWFGIGEQKQTVFGLPGNPQSSLVCLLRYVVPALRLLMARQTPKYQLHAKLMVATSARVSELTLFVPVRVDQDASATVLAYPLTHQGSGDFAALAQSDGFLEIPESEPMEEGRIYPLYLWQSCL